MKKYLKDIFIHLDGIAMTPIYELILNMRKKSSNYKEGIVIDQSLHGDYIFILCTILKAQNIVKKSSNSDNIDIYEWTKYAKSIFLDNHTFSGIKDYYISGINFIENQDSDDFSKNFNHIYKIYLKSLDDNGTKALISKHIEGALIAPILIYYRYTNSQLNIVMDILENHNNDFLKFLEQIDFIKNKALTEKGQYLLSKSYAYGVTDSYMRTFIHLDDLCFKPNNKGCSDKNISLNNLHSSSGNEIHVNRALNVWGSGKSHTTYFKHIDQYIIDIFNKPIEEQPKGIADMGCGDGSFLYHLNELIENNTIRGDFLDSHPILLIGADFNQAALNATSKTFATNKNKPMTVLADISKPDKYAEKVKSEYSLDISDFLNVRSFLDHNRTYHMELAPLKKEFKNITTNSFVWKGKHIPKHNIQSNLVYHFEKWKKYISKYGLLVLELHCINIDEIYKNIGKIPMTAYIATHGFSDQFMIEYEVYKECINLAGLDIETVYEKIFPSIDMKMISINLIS